MKRILSLLLAAVLLLSLAGCTTPAGTADPTTPPAAATATAAPTAGTPETAAPTEPPAEPTIFETLLAGPTVTLSLFPSSTNLKSGLLDTPIGDYMKEKYNFMIDAWAYSQEKYTTILASGDLPDIMYLTSGLDLENAILGNLIVKLEDRLEELPAIRDNEAIQYTLNYVRQFRSAGTGEVYAIPTGIGDGVTGRSNNMVSRWRLVIDYTYFYPYYKDTGVPEINDLYDVLDVLETLLKAYPTAEDGTKTYGTALYYSGGKYEASMQGYYYLVGYTVDNIPYFVETYSWDDGAHDRYSSIFADDSAYKDGVKWFNAMYRRGILDPDSINYNRQDAQQRNYSHYAMMGTPCLNICVDDFQMLYFTDQKSIYTTAKPLGSASEFLSIGANSKNIDAALVLFNSFSNPFDCLVYRNGPPGEMWDIEADGVTPFITPEYRAVQDAGGSDHGSYQWKTSVRAGEVNELWNTSQIYGGFVPELGDGKTYGSAMDKWAIVENYLQTERMGQFTEFYNSENGRTLLEELGQVVFLSGEEGVTNFCSDPSDEQELILAAVQTQVIDSTWKMIYATSDEEFEKLWTEMVDTCMTLGAQEIVDWRIEELGKANDIMATF